MILGAHTNVDNTCPRTITAVNYFDGVKHADPVLLRVAKVVRYPKRSPPLVGNKNEEGGGQQLWGGEGSGGEGLTIAVGDWEEADDVLQDLSTLDKRRSGRRRGWRRRDRQGERKEEG